MKKTPESIPSADVVALFQRHVVPLYIALRRGSDTRSLIITTFVMSVQDQWLLITAGHCITDITKATEAGYEVVKCCLIDTMGLGAKFENPVPFDYHDASPTMPFDDPAYDYGVIFVRDMYRLLLEANGVVPLTEQVWKMEPDHADFYMLIGIPAQYTKAADPISTVAATLHVVERLDERPEGFEETDSPTFYGSIRLGESLSSIEGMSGGPLFAFKQSDQGLKYWLHAVQSTWIKSNRHIAARLMRPLGLLIEDFMEGRHSQILGELPSGRNC